MDLNAKTCPRCHSRDVYTTCVLYDEKNECRRCGKLWGWYYDRNKPENKFKPRPN